MLLCIIGNYTIIGINHDKSYENVISFAKIFCCYVKLKVI